MLNAGVDSFQKLNTFLIARKILNQLHSLKILNQLNTLNTFFFNNPLVVLSRYISVTCLDLFG